MQGERFNWLAGWFNGRTARRPALSALVIAVAVAAALALPTAAGAAIAPQIGAVWVTDVNAGAATFHGGVEGHRHVLFGHIFSFHPFDTSFVITFEIKSAGKGTYGTVLDANLTKALGTQRNLTGIEMTLDRRYSYHGKRYSYVSAGCPAPKGFRSATYSLARTTFTFANGVTLKTTLTRTCGARG